MTSVTQYENPTFSHFFKSSQFQELPIWSNTLHSLIAYQHCEECTSELVHKIAVEIYQYIVSFSCSLGTLVHTLCGLQQKLIDNSDIITYKIMISSGFIVVAEN